MQLNTKNCQIYEGNKMAKIIEETIVIKLSKLVRSDEDDVVQLVNESLLSSIEESLQHQFSDAVVVEVERN